MKTQLLFSTLTTLLLFSTALSQTQNIKNRKLLFANKDGINYPNTGLNPTIGIFGAGPATWDETTTQTLFNGVEGLNHIEDVNGNIIAYISTTDLGLNSGGAFYDKNINKMPADTQKLNLGTKAEIGVCPNPANPDQWYVFYAWELGVFSSPMHEFHYTTIDFSLNGGLGNVVNYNALIPTNDVSEQIEVVEKADINGFGTNNFWVLTHERNNGLISFFVGPTGFNPASKTTLYNFNTNGLNQKPMGELEYTNGKLGWVDRDKDEIYFGDFDNKTGTYNHIFTIDLLAAVPSADPGRLYGLEFSPDATKLYVSFRANGQAVIYQFDLNSAAPFFNATLVGGPYGLNPWGDQMIESSMELALDGKIYCQLYYNTNIEIINNPNAAGPACNVTSQFIANYARSGGISDPIQYAQAAILPVTLVSYDVFLQEAGYVEIDWSTASEQHNDYFSIERSHNGEQFETIGRVAGAGNSNQSLNYHFKDTQPLPGISYYRLKQTDMDGAEEIFAVKAIEMDIKPTLPVLYPNPVRDKLNIELLFCGEQQVRVEISEFSGRPLASEIRYLHYGKNTIELHTESLAKGIYLVNIVAGNETMSVDKIIKR